MFDAWAVFWLLFPFAASIGTAIAIWRVLVDSRDPGVEG